MIHSMLLRILSSGFLACSIMCFGSEDQTLYLGNNVTAPSDRKNYPTLQTFFTNKDGKYIVSARLIAPEKIETTTYDFTEGYKSVSPSVLKEIKDICKYHGKGLYEGYMGENSYCWSFKTYTGEKSSPALKTKFYPEEQVEKCVNDYDWHNNREAYIRRSQGRSYPTTGLLEEMFYVKKIHHTGVTENLLNMPECSIHFESDYIRLKLSTSRSMFVVNPITVKEIRNKCLEGKIFVINMKQYDNENAMSYKILEYESHAWIQWSSWIPRFVRRYRLLLNGFEKPEEVHPEKEINVNLSEDKNYVPILYVPILYEKNKKIGKIIKFLSIGSSCLLLCYLFQDKIYEVLEK